MAYLQPDAPEKVYLPAIRAAKEKGEKLVCLTAYDYPTARIVDEAGVDMILVGDSIGNVIHGYGNTIPVSLEEICSALIAVKRGTERAMVIADMPYGTYHVSAEETVRHALKLMKYGGAEAIKLEGGRNRVDLVKRLVDEEIPVVAHIVGSFGMAPEWARAVRPLVLLFTAINLLVTYVFKANVDAQGGAYATGVLVLITSACVAALIDVWRSREGSWYRRLSWPFAVITAVFVYTTIANEV